MRRNSEPASVRTSCPLNKALIMPCRDEMSKCITRAFAVTERKANRTLREKGLRKTALCTRKRFWLVACEACIKNNIASFVNQYPLAVSILTKQVKSVIL